MNIRSAGFVVSFFSTKRYLWLHLGLQKRMTLKRRWEQLLYRRMILVAEKSAISLMMCKAELPLLIASLKSGLRRERGR